MENQYKHIGKSYDRKEAKQKVTGQAVYTHDLGLPGMLYAKCVHSPHARAKIVSIDTSKAKALHGVKAVIVGEDAPYLVGLYMIDKRVIAVGETRYQGEVIAAVAAIDEATAEKAVSLIDVKYEVLPAVLTIDESEEAKILVHEDINELEHMKGVFFPQRDSNIASWNKAVYGDIKKGFAEADHIIENSFYLPPVAHAPIETHVTVAKADPYSNRTKLWTSVQSPFATRAILSKALGLSKSDLEIVVPYVGGAFGGKAGAHLELLAILLSRAAKGRPVKLQASREEEFNQLPSRTAMRGRIKTGVKKDGSITAVEVYYDWDSGAYADYAVNVGKTAVYSGAGCYSIPNLELHSRTFYTNKVYSTAYRGFGHLETHWVIERQMDMIAQKLGMDPYELRQKNILKPGDRTISGEVVYESTGSPSECLKAVAKEIGWNGYQSAEERQKQIKTGKVRGKGIASLQKAPAMPTYTSTAAILQMDEDGKIKVLLGTIDMGQGINTSLAQIVAEVLDIPFEDVDVEWDVDTNKHPYDWNTVASKTTFMNGNAVKKAAENMILQMKTIAAQALRTNVDHLCHGGGYIYHVHHPHRRIAYKDFARGYVYENGNGIGGPLISQGTYMADNLTNLSPDTGQGLPALVWTFGAHGVDLEVDTETGDITILKVASAFDVGQVINQKLFEGQITGGVVQGVGSAILEGFKFSPDGKLMNPSFTDNKIPTAKDIPLKIVPMNAGNKQENGPFGARGVGEHPMISVPSAIANALYDALGINFYELPLTPEKVALAIAAMEKG